MKGSKCKCAGREAAKIIGGLQSEKDMKAQGHRRGGAPAVLPACKCFSSERKVPERVGLSHSEESRGPVPAAQAQPCDPQQLGQFSSCFSAPQ